MIPSMNTRFPGPLAEPPPCFTVDFKFFESNSLFGFLCTILLPSYLHTILLPNKLNLLSSEKITVFQKLMSLYTLWQILNEVIYSSC